MNICLSNVLPDPLREIAVQESSIWGKTCTLHGDHNYIIRAASGTGKTTLLSILYGVRHDYSGKVTMDDHDIRTITPQEWAPLRQTQISCVFQGLRLFDSLTVRENIIIKNRLTDTCSQEEIEQYAHQLHIASLLDAPVRTLSFGQKQRCAICRALCQPFSTLLLDEPFSHIDQANTNTALDLIIHVCEKNGANFILTSLDESSYTDSAKVLTL
ncbi:ATP-binding cassette domain-containing protein [Chitinivibrio alkaliphilus]|uniref:ABC transporter ATP-binding protein n=1 Tax=Chitinivibrio alkaliphilus ACht1 TaxID=1313304 RepID=U7DA71_9BACT|nr:ATP-binding cassette domain-containing protein [Chitinivibrio alkaliphilus]ERP38917.1 ABC transporter ATP-binding protein [Chitinivibrio alkaliphilus ACht1]